MKKSQKKIAKKTSFKNPSEKDYLAVILEDMKDKIDIIAEGHTILKDGIDNLSDRFDGLEGRFDGLQNEFHDFKKETSSNFKMVFEYLSNAENEIMDIKKELQKTGSGEDTPKWREELESRVARLENHFKIKKLSHA